MNTTNIEKLSEVTLSLCYVMEEIERASYTFSNQNYEKKIIDILMPHFEGNSFLDNMIQNYAATRFKKFQNNILDLLKKSPTTYDIIQEISDLDFDIKNSAARWRKNYGQIIEKKLLEARLNNCNDTASKTHKI